MLKDFLRKWLGIDGVQKCAALEKCELLEERLDQQAREIAALKHWRHDRAHKIIPIVDWETAQAMACAPGNFETPKGGN